VNRLVSVGFFILLIAASATARAVADEQPLALPALIPVVAVAPLNPLAHRHAKAPADEYFGHLKQSILGVRNVVLDIDARADNAAADAASGMCHKLVLAEDALRDWESKFPDDSWIPRFGYAMLKDYEKIDSVIVADDSHVAGDHAIDLANWLDATYPNSEFAPK